ncbi:MAG: D-alanine--D-alanine ligase [Puniceicoccaceae bacterium]
MSLKAILQSEGRRLAVLCGGESTEREVSLVSGKAVADAFTALGIPCDLFAIESNELPASLKAEEHIVLPVIHGTYGEDGVLSAELDRKGYLYGGSGMAASAICFDKLVSKAMAERLGIPVADELLLVPPCELGYGEISQSLGDAFILKPRRDGSSVGLHLVRCEADFKAAVPDMQNAEYLAEAYLDGIDLTVGVLDGNPMGVVAVRPKGGLYDYDHKYTSGMSEYEFPAKVEDVVTRQLQDWAKLIHDTCGCRDIARVDFRMSNTGSLIFLEINTLPGMTPTSLLPKSAQCEGLSFDDVICRWAEAALNRSRGTAK